MSCHSPPPPPSWGVSLKKWGNWIGWSISVPVLSHPGHVSLECLKWRQLDSWRCFTSHPRGCFRVRDGPLAVVLRILDVTWAKTWKKDVDRCHHSWKGVKPLSELLRSPEVVRVGAGRGSPDSFRWLIVGVVRWCRWSPLLLSWVICLFRPNCGHWHPQWQWWRTEDKRLKLKLNNTGEALSRTTPACTYRRMDTISHYVSWLICIRILCPLNLQTFLSLCLNSHMMFSSKQNVREFTSAAFIFFFNSVFPSTQLNVQQL